MDHLCRVFLMLSRLFIAALWSPARKGLTSWLLLVMFIVFLLLAHAVSWVRCGTCLYRLLIFAIFLTLTVHIMPIQLFDSLCCTVCIKNTKYFNIRDSVQKTI